MIRKPAVAGRFYSGSENGLRVDLEKLIQDTEPKRTVIGVLSPHAGYVYSGAVAGRLFGMIKLPETVLIIGPNHHGAGAPAALYPDGAWVTPLGTVAIESRLNRLLCSEIPCLAEDCQAHAYEHSLEVQVPFLQYLKPDVRIAAICIGNGDHDTLKRIGKGIAAAIRSFGEDVLILASSDMTHYESADSAERKDSLALDRLLHMDSEGLLNICRSEGISMCGAVPAVIMLEAALALGATSSELVCYATSGDVTGDRSQVVGYASAVVF